MDSVVHAKLQFPSLLIESGMVVWILRYLSKLSYSRRKDCSWHEQDFRLAFKNCEPLCHSLITKIGIRDDACLLNQD